MSGNDFLMSGGGAPTLTFPRMGERKGGRVLSEPIEYTVREYDPRNPGKGPIKLKDDGTPVKGVYIDLQTSERTGPEDNGIRRLYVDKWRLRDAIRDAVLLARAQGVTPGADLYVTWTGHEQGQGTQPALTWSAEYTPAQSAGQGALMAPPPVQPAPAQYVQPVAHYVPPAPAPAPAPVAAQPVAPAPAPAANVVPLAVYNAMVNAGVDVSGYVPAAS